MSGILDPTNLINTFGLIGIMVVLFAECGLLVGFFLPGDSLLFTAGLLAAGGLIAPLWVLLKIFALIFVFMWIRATVPRLRYDQLMSFGWKILLPLATLNVLVTAIVLVAT